MVVVDRSGLTKTKSFRIDEAFLKELEAEADKHGVSVNNLTEQIIDRYINHIRWIEFRKGLTILPDTMRVFLEYLDEKSLSEIGERTGAKTPKEGFILRGAKGDDKDALLLVSEVLGHYNNWFTVIYHEDNEKPYLYLRNSLGEKWLFFFEAFIISMYRHVLGQELNCTRVGDNLHVELA